MKKNNFIPYGRQAINQADIQAVIKTLKSDFLTQGPEIEKFEKQIAKYTGAKYAVAVSSGTAGLHAAYFAAGLTTGDEIITSPMTFAATANAALYLSAKPKFADIEVDTGNIDPDNIEKLINKHTKLIVPVHYAGHPARLKEIKKIADKHGLKVIADACHALGAKYQGKKLGELDLVDASVLSFHPVKHITTGEGGAIITNDENIYQRAKQFITHGITKDESLFVNQSAGAWYHEMQYLGFNYRLTDLQASLGLSQLKRNNEFVKMRREIARRYVAAFSNTSDFALPVEKEYARHAYHLYPIKLNQKHWSEKKQIVDKLHREGIGVQVHYLPVYRHPYYENLGYKPGLCPKAEEFYQAEISIPMFPKLTKQQQQRVIKTLQRVIS